MVTTLKSRGELYLTTHRSSEGWGTPDAELPDRRITVTHLDRLGHHAASQVFTSPGGEAPSRRDSHRLLTGDQLRHIYLRCPPVRSSVDSIVRLVSTQEIRVEMDPEVRISDEDYELAVDIAGEATRWLRSPNEDGEVWQEFASQWVNNLLVYDNGVVEKVQSERSRRAGDVRRRGELPDLVELVVLDGGTVSKVIDKLGRCLGYVQDIHGHGIIVGESGGPKIDLDKDDVEVLRLYPASETPDGTPIIETILVEVVSSLRASENVMLEVDASEVPPGILVLTGMSERSARTVVRDIRRGKGRDNRIRTLVSKSPKAEGAAKWLELKRGIKENEIRELLDQIRRTIYRAFGVMPVAQGETQDIPRAVGEVQVDAQNSHLILPILELLAARMTMGVVPRLVDTLLKQRGVPPEQRQRLRRAFKFCFNMLRELTPAELRDLVDAGTRAVEAGVLTRDEARRRIREAPIEGGDVLTVGSGSQVQRLADVLASDDDNETDDTPSDDDDGGDDGEEVDAPEPADEGAPGEEDGGERGRGHSCDHSPEVRELPSDWQSPGRFDGVRTLDLTLLGEGVDRYQEQVAERYDQASRTIQARVRARAQGGLTDVERQLLTDEITEELDALSLDWSTLTQPLYQEAARIGSEAAAGFSGVSAPNYSQRADDYHRAAMGYLAEGLMADIRNRLFRVIADIPAPTRAIEDAGDAAEAIAEEMEAERYRIDNYSGRLVELGYLVLSEDIAANPGTEEVETGDGVFLEQPVDWWCEWVKVGDGNTCPTCDLLGGQGYVRLATLPTMPGGATECRAKCRCVLVLWKRSEIDAGQAVRLND